LACWRLRAQRAGGRHGNLLRCRGLTNSYCYGNSNCHTDSRNNAHCYADSDTYTDANADSRSNAHSYADSDTYTDSNANNNSNSDRNAHGDGHINPMYGKMFTDTEASAYSSAPTVVVRRADLSAVASAKAGE